MKLTAIDAASGKILMTQAGSMSEADFKNTVLNAFPQVDEGKVIIVIDGRIAGKVEGRAKQPPSRRGTSVVWIGSFSDGGGYASLNREIVLRLQHHGISPKLRILKTAPQVDAMTQSMLRVMESAKIPNEKTCPLVVGFTPMPVQGAGRRVIFYTMMETQGLHPEFVDRCNKSATEVWVPGDFYEKVFRENGVKRPVFNMPLGVNHNLYTPEAKAPLLAYEDIFNGDIITEIPDGFRFMSLFGWSYRKGSDVLCRSFLQEFDGADDACLIIYSRYMGSPAEQHKQYIRDEIRGYYKEIDKKLPARIYYCGDVIPIQDVPGCYSTADAFVFCSRGEGFGLPVCEAGACGIPVISAYNTAMTDYLDDDVAYCIPTDAYASANDKLCWISGYYRDQKFAVLGEEAIKGFRRAMRDVYSKPKEAEIKAQKFRERVLQTYTWDICAERVAKKLKSG